LRIKLIKPFSNGIYIILILSILLILTLTPIVQSIPPDDGDWTVKDQERVEHRSITLTGDLIIKNGGELILNDVDLKFNSAKDYEYKIHIEDGGELEMRYSSINLNADYSIVIIVEPEGNLKIYNSTIYEFSTIEPESEDVSSFDVTFLIIIIIVVMIIIILLAMAIAMKSYKKRLEKLIGNTGEVVNTVNPDNFQGTVRVGSQTLNAKAKGEFNLEFGVKVKVVDIEGLFLIVEKNDE